MPVVKQKGVVRREAPANGDTAFKILINAINVGGPATKRKIAQKAGVSNQLVDYHVGKLMEEGLMVSIDDSQNGLKRKLYAAQPLFYSSEVMEQMHALIMGQDWLIGTPGVMEAGGALWDQTDLEQTRYQPHELGAVVENILIHLLKLLVLDFEGLRRVKGGGNDG